MRGQLEGKMQFGKSNSNINSMIGKRAGGLDCSSHDRLIYVSTCLIGLPVEVHVRNGSTFSGIFHTMSTEKDFGIVLKMARLITDGSQIGQKIMSEAVKRPQTVIIPSRELVQVVAKDVRLTGDEFSNGNTHEKHQDLMIDSAISLPHHVEERELERWAPDDDDPQCPELENIFDGSWNRKWDQFETNETLFGVKSTFDEELYTTKLERGPQMRELERKALQIAREIEGEEPEDLHLAEERGFHPHEDSNFDEESRYSAVYRGVDNDACDENDHINLSSNMRKFGHSSDSSITSSFPDSSEQNVCDAAPTSTSTKVDNGASSNNPSGTTLDSDFANQAMPVPVDRVSINFISLNDESRKENHIAAVDGGNNLDEKAAELKDVQSEDSTESLKVPISDQPVNSRPRPSLSSSNHVGGGFVSSGPCLPPNLSTGSLISEKSKLNPYAKEFKFNPNAKSFTPSSSSLRPQSPVSDGSFYYATNVSAVPPMHNLPVGVGIGPPYGGNQPVVYNPQAVPMQSTQSYIHPNGPLYQQQMYLGQPRPVLYMPPYHPSPEMPYRGREF